MSATSPSTQNLFRILLYRRDSSEILLESTPEGFRLPILSVPAHRREAQEITSAIRASWDLESYGLFGLPAVVPPHPLVLDYVLEACQPDSGSPDRMEWFCVAALSVGAFQSPSDLAAVRNSLLRLDQYRRGELPGPFGKPGWLPTVTEWVAAQTAAAGLSLTGRFRQLNASSTFSLIRFATDGPALWFKAVGEPNLHEYPITLALSRYFPGYTAKILATRQDWNGWLAIEAEGRHPADTSGIQVWIRVATALAELQIASVPQTLHLREIGCCDMRSGALLTRIGPFFEGMTELMAQQSKQSPAPLSRRELLDLRTQVQDVLSENGYSKIPNAIGHLDFNAGNIVANDHSCIFLDWAEGCVGHPFLTFQYLLESFRRVNGGNLDAEKLLTSAYATPWQLFASPEVIGSDLEVAPLLAVLSCATIALQCQNSNRISSETAGYLRSLTRRVKREADALLERRRTCAP